MSWWTDLVDKVTDDVLGIDSSRGGIGGAIADAVDDVNAVVHDVDKLLPEDLKNSLDQLLPGVDFNSHWNDAVSRGDEHSWIDQMRDELIGSNTGNNRTQVGDALNRLNEFRSNTGYPQSAIDDFNEAIFGDVMPANVDGSIENEQPGNFMDAVESVGSANAQNQSPGTQNPGSRSQDNTSSGFNQLLDYYLSKQQNDNIAQREGDIMDAQTDALSRRLNQLYPNTSQWERLGSVGSGSGIGSGVNNSQQHRFNKEIKKIEGDNMANVAKINVAKGGLNAITKELAQGDLKYQDAEKIADISNKWFNSFNQLSTPITKMFGK